MEFDDAVLSRRSLLVAGAVTVVGAAGWQLTPRSKTTQRGAPASYPPTPLAPGSTRPSTTTMPLTPSSVLTSASSTTLPPLAHELRPGMVDPKVRTVQQLLSEQRFDPGPIDGYFGQATQSAVWAFEKLHLGVQPGDATGVVTDELWQRLHTTPTATAERAPGGRHVEVFLHRQVALVFEGGEALIITHVSSGSGESWCDEVTVDEEDGSVTTKGICGVAVTPGGVYHVERKVDGWRNAPLGRLYKPIYFNYGIAIHGATNVPVLPASRGCVRVPLHVAEYLPSLLEVGDTVYVFDGVEAPETYGAQLPVFDRPDPNYVTTTSSTTTTTVPPTSTVG